MPVPAWKRLGLKLKNAPEDAPGSSAAMPTKAPVQEATGTGSAAPETPKETPSATETPSGLGKRKWNDEPADAVYVKKSRTDGESNSAAAESTHAEGAAKPKGDPNYRMKKKKNGFGEKPWKKKAAPDVVEARPHLLPSTETSHHVASPSVSTPLPAKGLLRHTSLEHSPSRGTDRRKSVAFTPDTKKVDGTSAHNLFKQWAAEHKAAQEQEAQPEPTSTSSEPVTEPQQTPSETAPKPKTQKRDKQKTPKTANTTDTPPESTPTTKPKPKAPAPAKAGKKKDPSIYLSYLEEYASSPSTWKFNKAKQNDVLENALNIFRIPDSHADALISYIRGLQGAAIIERTKQRCQDALKQLDDEDAKDGGNMSLDTAARDKVKSDALTEALAKSKKRRQTDADLQELAQTPDGQGYIRSLKRHRAIAVMNALSIAIPLGPLPVKKAPVAVQEEEEEEEEQNKGPAKVVRKRKSRTEVSSDESSSSSSEEDSSSDDDSSDDDSSDDDSSDDSDSDSDDEASAKADASDDSDSSSSSSSSSDIGSDDSGDDSSGSDGDTEDSDSDDSD